MKIDVPNSLPSRMQTLRHNLRPKSWWWRFRFIQGEELYSFGWKGSHSLNILLLERPAANVPAFRSP